MKRSWLVGGFRSPWVPGRVRTLLTGKAEVYAPPENCPFYQIYPVGKCMDGWRRGEP